MKKIVHPVAGTLALVTIVTFWLATSVSELTGSTATIVAVKLGIPWGFVLLLPCIAIAGGTGFTLSNGAKSGLARNKLKRMPIVAAIGLLVLMPAALFLASRAQSMRFDTGFYLVQALELIAGGTNVVLLSLNLLDGLKLTGRFGFEPNS